MKSDIADLGTFHKHIRVVTGSVGKVPFSSRDLEASLRNNKDRMLLKIGIFALALMFIGFYW